MFNPFLCAGCDEHFEDGQFYWEFYNEDGDLFYLDEFCRDAYLLDQRRQYTPTNYCDEGM
ncbi:MAG: hypothetical protein WCP73_03680 [Eubacteriales bacterium]